MSVANAVAVVLLQVAFAVVVRQISLPVVAAHVVLGCCFSCCLLLMFVLLAIGVA